MYESRITVAPAGAEQALVAPTVGRTFGLDRPGAAGTGRLVAEAARRGEVGDGLVRALSDDAEPIEVVEDALDEPRVTQERERRVPLLVAELRARGLVVGRLLRGVFLQLLETEQHHAKVALDDLLVDAQLLGRERGVLLPLPGRVELERVDVEAGALARDEELHLEGFEARVLGEAADAPLPVPEGQRDLVAARRGARRDQRCGRRPVECGFGGVSE